MAGFEHGGVRCWATTGTDDNEPEGFCITNTDNDNGVTVSVSIANGQPVGVIVSRSDDGGDTIEIISRWGMVPAWWAE